MATTASSIESLSFEVRLRYSLVIEEGPREVGSRKRQMARPPNDGDYVTMY